MEPPALEIEWNKDNRVLVKIESGNGRVMIFIETKR